MIQCAGRSTGTLTNPLRHLRRYNTPVDWANLLDYNDLLIEILNMTPEERKQPVRFATDSTWAVDTYQNVNYVHKSSYDGTFLTKE